MNTPEPVAPDAVPEQVAAEPAVEAPREPVVTRTEREVTLQRSVRIGRIMIGFGVIGVLVAVVWSLMKPVAEGATYTLAQATGFMSLIGAVVGITVGGLVSLILVAVAKRNTGTGVAIQTDVR